MQDNFAKNFQQWNPPPPPRNFILNVAMQHIVIFQLKKGGPTSGKSPEEVSALCEALRGGCYPALEAEGAARTAFHDSIIDANPVPGDFEAAASKIASAPSVQAELEGTAGQALALDEIAVGVVVPGVADAHGPEVRGPDPLCGLRRRTPWRPARGPRALCLHSNHCCAK